MSHPAVVAELATGRAELLRDAKGITGVGFRPRFDRNDEPVNDVEVDIIMRPDALTTPHTP